MTILLSILNALLPLFYLVLAYLYGVYFFKSPRWVQPQIKRLLPVVLVVHFVEILLRGLLSQRFPLVNFAEAMAVLALAIMLIYLYAEYRIKTRNTGFFILLLVFPLQFVSSALINFEHQVPELLDSPLLVFHTTSAMLGYAALFISALYGLMYLMLFHEIKSAQFGIIYRRMPSLEELSEMNVRTAVLGFLLLTLAIAVGIIWRKSAYPDAPHFDPKVISAYSVWIIYGLAIYGKRVGKWTAKSVAYVSLGGFSMILLSRLIVNFFWDSFHRFG